MRKIGIAAGSIVVAAVSLYGFSLYRTERFQSALPASLSPPPLPEIPSKISTITMPIKIKLAAIKSALNAKVDRNGTGGEDNFAGGLLKNDRLDYAWTRGDFQLAEASGLKLTVPLQGTASAGGKFIFAHVSASGKANGTAWITIKPALKENWRVAPNAGEFGVNLDLAELKLGVKISVKTALSNIIRNAANKEIEDLNAKAESDPFFENAVRKVWPNICRTVRLDLPGGDQMYVRVEPQAVEAAQPIIAGEDLDLLVGIKASVRITSNPAAPSCPFPASLTLVPPAPAGRIEVAIPIETSFEQINRTLAKSIAGHSFEDAKRGLSLSVHSLKVRPFGQKLLVVADVTLRTSGVIGYVKGQASGTVYATAEPILDPKSRTLVLRDVKLDVASQRPLTTIFGDAAAGVVETLLADNAKVDFGRDIERVKGLGNKAVEDLNKQSENIKIDAKLDSLNVDDLAFDGDKLRILVTASGTARTDVNQLEIDK